MNKRFVSYYRISIAKSGGLDSYGIAVQRSKIAAYLSSQPGAQLVASHEEVETGSCDQRKALTLALADCKRFGACLITSHLSRLSRRASFILALMDSNVEFLALDCPEASSKLHLQIMAIFAQSEKETLQTRIRDSLRIAKSKGVILGAPPESLAESRKKALRVIQERKRAFNTNAMKAITDVMNTGINSLSKVADILNRRAEPTARGNGKWTRCAVDRVVSAMQDTTICNG
jgi:DNA invertase Pin-like site-specific DNA recombinase